jgi:Amt family ammonium transporter
MSDQERIAELEAQVASLFSMVQHEDRSLILGPATFDSGDTAWMLTSTALVLFMTVPGLALYYSGMVRVENVLATSMQIFSITCLITALWMFFGYSLSFAPANADSHSTQFYGDGSRIWLRGMTMHNAHQLAPTIPEPIFCAFQLTFAIITPSLICGSFADRMKYVPMLIFMTLWHFIVYCPIAHAVWHPDGFLHEAEALDFAGGCVVHIASGISGLMSTLVIGNRRGFGDPKLAHLVAPHNILYTVVGTCMLWVGWFGFNGGSALTSGGNAAMALLVTHISTAFAAISWLSVEWFFRGKPSVLGMVNGAVAGLVSITPACGYVDPTGAFFIGIIGGAGCYAGAQVKHYVGYDDALDAFGVHAVGGIIGGILTGFFASEDIYGYDGVFYANTHDGGHQLAMQLYGIVVCAGWAAFASFILLQLIDKTIGLRVNEETEAKGLDLSYHNESIVPTVSRRNSAINMSTNQVADPYVVEKAVAAKESNKKVASNQVARETDENL